MGHFPGGGGQGLPGPPNQTHSDPMPVGGGFGGPRPGGMMPAQMPPQGHGGPPPPHLQAGGGYQMPTGQMPGGGGPLPLQHQQLDPESQNALLQQVMSLTPQEIDVLPEEHKQQVYQLQQQLRQQR
mmetsp:Transcript_10311/g.29426  ORF Transcript_10311/g.29426 Transcript_10311/m.29426 type:complete len:126 (+) Transcript_10311:2-379(+)